MKGTRSKVEWG